MTALDAAILFGVGTLAGVLNVIAGGGTILTLPILIFYGLPPAMANGTNRLAILFQNGTAMLRFHQRGALQPKFGFLLAIPAIVGAWWGAQLAVQIDSVLFNRILAILMVVTVLAAIVKPKNTATPRKQSVLLTFVLFFFVGVYGGFIQAGVGFLILSALSLFSGMSLARANAIKLVVIFCYSFVALASFSFAGAIQWDIAIVLALGNIIGALVGSQLALSPGSEKLVKIFLFGSVSLFSIKLFLS